MSPGQFFYLIDIHILQWFNVDWASPQSDAIWKVITHLERQWWVILILLPLLLLRLIYIYKTQAIKPLVAVAIAVGLSDTIAYRGIKSLVDRPRPFQNQELS